MPLSINTSNADHNLDLAKLAPHEVEAAARSHAKDAWFKAGGPADGFASWWDRVTNTIGFDNLKALVGMAWEHSSRQGGRNMVDTEFHAWWDSVSGQDTLAAHDPSVKKRA